MGDELSTMLDESDLSESEKKMMIAVLDSLKRGKGVRRRSLLWCSLWLVATLLTLVALDAPDAIFIATTIVAASLCIVWAIMTLSASMNSQLDAITSIMFPAEK